MARASRLVLDVVYDQTIRLEPTKSGYLLSRDLSPTFGVRRQLRWGDSVETNPCECTVELFEKCSQADDNSIETAVGRTRTIDVIGKRRSSSVISVRGVPRSTRPCLLGRLLESAQWLKFSCEGPPERSEKGRLSAETTELDRPVDSRGGHSAYEFADRE